jgi:hypothetical protein
MGDRIIFTGFIAEKELKYYLSKATMVIINKYENMQITVVFPQSWESILLHANL